MAACRSTFKLRRIITSRRHGVYPTEKLLETDIPRIILVHCREELLVINELVLPGVHLGNENGELSFLERVITVNVCMLEDIDNLPIVRGSELARRRWDRVFVAER